MWEKVREDGKRALRWNAIPTLLECGNFPVINEQRKPRQLQLQLPAQQQSLLRNTNRLILPKPNVILSKPDVILPINNFENVDKSPINNSEDVNEGPIITEIRGAVLEEPKVYIDPLHNYCRKGGEDNKSSIVKSLLKTKQNKAATITNNDTDKFHNYFSKEGNPKSDTPVWVHAKNFIPIKPQ